MAPEELGKPLPLLPATGSGRHRWGRAFTCLLTFTAGLVLVGTLVDSGFDLRPEGRLERGSSSYKKTLAFREGKDEYEVVFVGSSRVQRGIYPETFDRTMEELGRPLRSFNFGLGGVRFPEAVYWIDWILSLRPRKLRWLFIELQPLQQWVQPQHGWTSKRFVNWHSAASTALALRTVRVAQPEAVGRRARGHANSFLRRSLNLGLGVFTLREAFLPWSSPLPQAGYDWRDEDAHPLPLGQGWQLYQAQAPAKAVGPLERSTGGAPAEIPALMAETLSALIAHLEAHGVQPIFFLGPAGRPRDDVRSVFEAGLLPNLFAYELGTGYRLAERYNEENPSAETAPKDYFSDSLHLNEAGARIFGKWLAEDFHGFLEAQGRTAK